MSRAAGTMGRLACVLLLAAFLFAGAAAQDFAIESASRRINLKNAWAKVTDSITAKNTGKAEAKELVACYVGSIAPRISLIKALAGKARQDVSPLAEPPAGAPPGAGCYRVALKSPVKAGGKVELDVVATVTGAFRPNPAKIQQGDQQYVEYTDNLYLLSPYAVASQTATVTLPNADVKSFTEEGGTKAGGKVTYTHGKQGPWAAKELKLHFHHNRPFKRVNSLVREIEVSHWGNIYVEETYEIQNAGAEHIGKFSRLQYAYTANGKTNSFPDVRARLPGPAHSLYYKDLIGNISSSDTTRGAGKTTIELRLRYPLMGGWKTDFTLGYSLPLEGFLYRRPKGKLRLLMDLSTSFDDVWVDSLTTRVVLPEGAKNIKCTLPFEGISQSWDKKFTYLDTVGRPVLVLTAANVVPEHNKQFAVDYGFTLGAMLREPLLLIGVFAALFAAVSVLGRVDLTITKDDRWLEAQARDRAAGLLQQLAAVWDAEADLLQQVIRLAHSISNAPSAAAVQESRLALEARLKDQDGKAKALIKQLEDISGKVAAAARDHADKGKSLQQRAAKLLGDKADLIKKGVAAHEAAAKVSGPTKQLTDATRDWAGEGARLASA